MKRSVFINVASMRKALPAFALAPLALAVLSGCSEQKPVDGAATFTSNVADCNGMTGKEVTACEASYYRAKDSAQKELPRFTSAAECEKIYGTCEKPSDGSSVLVPLMAGYIAAQMVNDLGDGFRSRSSYYRNYPQPYNPNFPQARRDNNTSYGGSAYSSNNNTTRTTTTGAQPAPKVAPPPKQQKTVTKDRGGMGSTAKAKSSWGSSSKSSGG